MPWLNKNNPPLFLHRDDGSNVRLGEDNMEIPDPAIPMEMCELALGTYMTAWNQVEQSLTFSVQMLLDIDDLRAAILTETIPHAAVRDLLADVASHYLKKSDQAALSKLMEELRGYSGIRNKLVHGHWTIHIKLDPKTKKPTLVHWSRDSMVFNKETLYAMMDQNNQKSQHLRKKNQFDHASIIREALKLRPFADKLTVLVKALTVSRDNPKEQRSRHQRVSPK